jgi:hypothetical protein
MNCGQGRSRTPGLRGSAAKAAVQNDCHRRSGPVPARRRPRLRPARIGGNHSTRKTGAGSARQRAVPGGRRPQPGQPRRHRGGGPTDRRPAASGLGGQAGARRQGLGDRAGQESGVSLADPRLDAASRSRRPIGPPVPSRRGDPYRRRAFPHHSVAAAPGPGGPGRAAARRTGRRRRRPVGVPRVCFTIRGSKASSAGPGRWTRLHRRARFLRA